MALFRIVFLIMGNDYLSRNDDANGGVYTDYMAEKSILCSSMSDIP